MSVPIHSRINVFDDWQGAFKQYIIDANTSYICKAAAGTNLTAYGWSICKYYKDATEKRITWAQDASGQATTEFVFIASNYAGYTYS
jgi:hypothetical protein